MHNNQQGYTWKTVVTVLACLVALSTVCAMILPAVAMDQKCALEEHQHSEQCYTWIADSVETPAEEDEPTPEPLPSEQAATVSEQEDARGHWELTCEIPEHTHTDACLNQQAQTPEISESPETTETTDTTEQTVEPTQSADGSESTEPTQSTEPSQPVEGEQEETPSDVQTPQAKKAIAVESYVETAVMKYKSKAGPDSDAWQEMEQGVPIPGDAKLRLEVKYDHVSITNLVQNGCQMTFDIPEIMRNPEAQGDITDDNHNTVGTTTVDHGVLTMTFQREWLERILNTEGDRLYGSFFVESDINLSLIPGDHGAVQIIIGEVKLDLIFDKDVSAKHGNLEIVKSVSNQVIKEADGQYLEYTLTATAGTDALPDVKVVDRFIENAQYIEYVNIMPQPAPLNDDGAVHPREIVSQGKKHGTIYKGAMPTQEAPIPEANATDIAEPGSLVWNIGDMEANEMRTLIYRVKLKDHYTDLVQKNERLRNEAISYSKIYQKDSGQADFKPKAAVMLNKSNQQIQRNPQDGSYLIRYTVWLEANRDNTYTIEDVKISDRLNHPDHPTDPTILNYVHYVRGSLQVFDNKHALGDPVELNAINEVPPTVEYNEDQKGFVLSVGKLAPGQSYSFQYEVKVDAAAFGAANTQKLQVKNRAVVTAKNASMPSKDFLNAYSHTCNLEYQRWIHKSMSGALKADETVALTGAVYDATNGEIVEEINHPENFLVPAGSYPYTVTLNELGDWDITKADIRDILKTDYLRYAGYLKVEAFDTKTPVQGALGTLAETRWMKIDGKQSFALQLTQIGLTENTYAYRLSYYARPVNMGNVSHVVAGNNVQISGTAGINGQEIQLKGFQAETQMTMEGGHSFESTKYAWYYEKPMVARGAWSNGAIYWGIKVNGTQLHAGTFIRDFVKNEGGHPERGKITFHDDSFVGVYKGALPDGMNFNSYSDLNDLLSNTSVVRLDDSVAKATYGNRLNFPGENAYSEVIVEVLHTIPIEQDESVFLIFKSEPDPIPTTNRTKKLFTNYHSTSDNGIDWLEKNQATKTLYGGQNILKEFGKFFSFDGTNIKDLTTGMGGLIPQGALKEPGHYIAWASKVNFGGDLAGRYRIVDVIPQGTEIAFARMKWLGAGTRNNNVQMCRIDNYQQALGDGWTEHTVTAPLDENLGNVTSYYYTKDNMVLWDVENLIAGHQGDNFAVDFQIVCRVADPEVLQGGQSKEFVNEIYLQNHLGELLDGDTSGVSVSASNVDKSSVRDGNTVKYTIHVNPLGENLVPGNDEVTLMDDMSENLRLDLNSLQVVNTNTKEKVEFRAFKEDEALGIVLPDSTPITICYTANIVAVPGTKITLSNKAYWRGHAQEGGDDDRIENFYYTVGGSAGGAKFPSVVILKYDEKDIMQRLPDAQFLMEEGTMQNGVFVPNGKNWKGTTAQNGELHFGTSSAEGKRMEYNTVYRVTETKAPEGYLLDGTPYYFLVAEKKGDTYPAYPDGVDVHYASAVYTLRFPNGKAKAYVEKAFQKVDGTAVDRISGTYRFGLFDNPQGTGEPLQVVSLTVTDTTTSNREEFVNLEKGKAYYVFELDDSSKPILPDSLSYVDSRPFQVSYQSDSGREVNAVIGGSTVTVTNRLAMDSLPETGGMGTGPFTVAGLLFLCAGLWMAYCRLKEQPHSKQ